MSRDDLLLAQCANHSAQVGLLAEQVSQLLGVIRRQAKRGADTRQAEDQMAILESLMWRLHQRQMQLRIARAGPSEFGRRVLN